MTYSPSRNSRGTRGCVRGLFILVGVGIAAWVLALGLLWLMPSSSQPLPQREDVKSAPVTPPLDFGGFNPGNIISDAKLHDQGTMDEAQIRQFIADWNAGCQPGEDGTPCLSEWVGSAPSFPEDQYCWAFEGGESMTAAEVIYRAAQACELNPQAILVILQKEQGLITASGHNLVPYRYSTAMGYGCPDDGECAAEYKGFARQVYYAARQFQKYRINPGVYEFHAGQTQSIPYHASSSCGASEVFIENQATASLYNYTPHQPNDAALAGREGRCSSWGNLHFYAYWKAWFGSTH